MKRLPIWLIVVGVVLTAGACAVALRTVSRASRATHPSGKAVYYCPMHPSYTSDRPGDCPICNMKLVKREPSAALPQAAHPGGAATKDVCYMHNCPMMHDGQPCPMLVVAKAGERVTCPICGAHVAETSAASKRILYWTDPMLPGYRSDRPGKSPMGMDLVPVYEEAAGTDAGAAPDGYAAILLTPHKQQLIGIKTAPVAKQHIVKTIRAAGVIAHDPELYQAQQELIQAQQSARSAAQSQLPDVAAQSERLAESSRLRLRHLGLSESMINEIATWTEPDHRLLLGGGGEYWVYASIYEYELPLVREDQPVSVEVSAVPGRDFEGAVKAIDPMIDQATRTARARILVKDAEGALRPGMYVNALIRVDLGDVLAVPAEAVFDTGTKRIVFVDQGQGIFEPHDVVVGAKADGAYEVKSGLAEGESVVTSGNFLIDSESRLKAAIQDMAPVASDEAKPTGNGGHTHGP